jgi:hypothetical protein
LAFKHIYSERFLTKGKEVSLVQFKQAQNLFFNMRWAIENWHTLFLQLVKDISSAKIPRTLLFPCPFPNNWNLLKDRIKVLLTSEGDGQLICKSRNYFKRSGCRKRVIID